MIEIKQIKADETYALRHLILRPHQQIEDCIYETDFEETTFHIGVYQEGTLVTVVSFNKENHPDYTFENQYRLRAMATLEMHRGKGLGRMAVTYAEAILRDLGVSFIWCNGRTNVENYYEKLGFKRRGEVFDYPPIGPHIVMVKTI